MYVHAVSTFPNNGLEAAPTPDGERRLQDQAYAHWESLLRDNRCPSIEALNANAIGPRGILLDLTRSRENPGIVFIGGELRAQSGLDYKVKNVRDVPGGSLVSRLTDHYFQVVANKSPVGFEAEFVDNNSVPIKYRGILLPFTSGGDTIDFVCGAISWTTDFEREAGQPADRDSTAALPAIEPEQDGLIETLQLGSDEIAGLSDLLTEARNGANAAQSADARSRTALYKALSSAYDFALEAERHPDDYNDLLRDSGVKAQARAPMTPVIKLVFGADYNKSRVTEFACALSFAKRQRLGRGDFLAFAELFEGGLKGLVEAERKERRPSSARADVDFREALRSTTPLASIGLDTEGDEFLILVARRTGPASVAVLAPVEDSALVERAIRLAAQASLKSRAARL